MHNSTNWIIAVVALLAIGGQALSAAPTKEAPKPKTTVHREGDRVWLEGVKLGGFGDQDSSVHAAQAAAMQALGYSVSYDYLLGVSGLAFRIQVSKDGLCPSSPHSACGYQCIDRAVEALPCERKGYGAKAEETEKVKGIRQAVMASIERGVPVQYGSEEDGLIVGYQKNGDEWICLHPMRDGAKKTFIETTWPWGVTVYTSPKGIEPARRDLIVASLQQAVKMANLPEVKMANSPEIGGYFLGFNAWDRYIEKLEALDTADEKTLKDAMTGNAWIYECLGLYRLSAVRYLRSVAKEFGAPAAKHLKKAADLYEQMATKVLTDEKHSLMSVAPYPWSKEVKEWTAEMRHGQIRRLRKALPLERRAIEEIKSALAAMKG